MTVQIIIPARLASVLDANRSPENRNVAPYAAFDHYPPAEYGDVSVHTPRHRPNS